MDEIRPIYGVERARGRRAELFAQTSTEFLEMHLTSAYTTSQVERAAPLGRALRQRGVSIREIGVPATEGDESRKYGLEMHAYGSQYRELPDLPTRLWVMDRATALLRLVPDDGTQGMWEITGTGVVTELVDFFLHHWCTATVPDRGWVPPMTLTPRERAIMALLAAGYTDAAVAEHLDVSVRTVAYTVRNLMDQYEVHNRFQLGLVLGAEAVRADDPGNHEEE